MRVRSRGFILFWICFCLAAFPVGAQSALTVRLSAPDTQAFPTISAYLDVDNADGNNVQDLKPEQVSVLEEGALLPIDILEEIHPGVQAVVAISPGPAFAIRNFQAVSRYDIVKEELRKWANSRQGTTTDDLSLLITDGPAVSHASSPAQFLAGLDSDQVDDRTAKSSIDTLARAIALAADATPRPGMGRVVLFVTSSIEEDIETALKDILDQARQQNIRIHIWMVASSGALTTQSAQKLMGLASGTGGQVFTFSGSETLPNPEEYLEVMRSIYRIEYQSKVGLSGMHEFAVQVQLGDQLAQSNTQNFQVQLLPPQPAFISPPIIIERRMPQSEDGENPMALPEGKETVDFLFPKETNLQVVFDFPDGRKRDLVRSALLVDGVVVAENQAPPFDQFTWDLNQYSSDATHQLQVQASDVLGLTGTSINIPVQITVEKLQADPWFVLRRNLVTISVILAVLAGGFLFLILVLGGKLRPVAQRASHRWRKFDPVTIPVMESDENPGNNLSAWTSRKHRPHMASAPSAIAFLHRVSDAEDTADGAPIPITSDETLLGSDPTRSNLVLADDCIEGLHARLTRKADRCFWLADQGSIAGTWINYSAITQEETRLQNGDLVHFGRIGFRFTVREPTQVLKPAISLESGPETVEPEEEPEEPAE